MITRIFFMLYLVFAVSCAHSSGAKPPYKDFPNRSIEQSLWKFKDETTLLKKKCRHWKRDNTCRKKDQYFVEIPVSKAAGLDMYVIDLQTLIYFLDQI